MPIRQGAAALASGRLCFSSRGGQRIWARQVCIRRGIAASKGGQGDGSRVLQVHGSSDCKWAEAGDLSGNSGCEGETWQVLVLAGRGGEPCDCSACD